MKSMALSRDLFEIVDIYASRLDVRHIRSFKVQRIIILFLLWQRNISLLNRDLEIAIVIELFDLRG